jgi:transposase-like protein
MAKADQEREERRRQQKEIADSLKASLERGLEAEWREHVAYDRGAPDAAEFSNLRNSTFAKTVASEIGDVELAVPRDRDGTFTPMLVPNGTRRLDRLDAIIVSLHSGGMTIRDIGHHLASTIGTSCRLRRFPRSPTPSATRSSLGSSARSRRCIR